MPQSSALARTIVGSWLIAVAVFSVSAVARAQGTVTIRQADGGTDTYANAGLSIIHSDLFVTSRDHKGTLVVHKSACSYQGDVMVCFPTGVTLIQGGEAKPLSITTGTVYLNLTDSTQQLVLSTTKVPPKSVLISFSTKRGTFVSVVGRIDKVVK
jgi:hypothetical protein